MPDPSMSVRERDACFGPFPEPDDPELECKSAALSCGTDSAVRGSYDADANDSHSSHDATSGPDVATLMAAARPAGPDYKTMSISANWPFLATVGVTASYTVDRFGHEYWGVGVGAGVGIAPPVAVSGSAGNLVQEDGSRTATEEQLRRFLCGDAVGVKAGVAADAGITNSSGGTAVEWGATTAVQAGVSFSHNWGTRCP